MQLLLNIKDKNKATLLYEFLKSLNYVSNIKRIDEEQEFDVPEWHKEIVINRMNVSDSSKLKPWSEVKKQLKPKK